MLLSPRLATALTGGIRARGHRLGGAPESAENGTYVLSPNATSLGLTPETALFDGANQEWRLFDGTAPLEMPGDVGPEVIAPNSPTDFCSQGDQSGFSIFNVSVPSLVSFPVPLDQPGRTDAGIIIAPGGGYRFLSWTKEGTRVAKWLNSIGFSAFVLKYRVPCNSVETHGKSIIDAQRAVRQLRAQSTRMGLNKSRIGLMGFSAGGFLASDAATSGAAWYHDIDPVDRQSDYLPDFLLQIYGYGAPPSRGVRPLPTFIAIAEDDPCVEASGAELVSEIFRNRFPTQLHELHIFSKGNHGYGDCSLFVNGGISQPVCAWTVNAQLFLENVLGIQRYLSHQPIIAPPLSHPPMIAAAANEP
jgi:hypothetical protein